MTGSPDRPDAPGEGPPRADGGTVARVFDIARRRRGAVLAVLVVLTLLAGVRLATVPLDTSIDAMLPQRADVLRPIRFLRGGNLGESVVVSFARNPSRTGVSALHEAVDRFARSVGPPLVTRVVSDVPSTAIDEDIEAILRRLPEVLSAEDLAALDARLDARGVDASVRARYRQLLGPQMVSVATLAGHDPLDLAGGLLHEVNGLVSAIGYDVELDSGHLVSPDRTRALVILRTSVKMTDAEGSARLLDYLDQRVRDLPAGVTADVVSGHAHTVANERAMRSDLGLTLSAAGAGFIVVFLLCFRDARAAVVFLIPAVAVALAMAGVAAVVGSLSAFVVGIGGVVAGITDDYGIHAYVAAREGADTRREVLAIARPMTLGAMTTAAVFGAFFFSSIPGYRELAWFSVLTIALALGCSLFVLPQWIPAHGRASAPAAAPRPPAAPPSRARDRVVAAALAVGLAVLAVVASRVTFDGDLTRLDGSSDAVRAADRRFAEDWLTGGSEPAMLVVERDDQQAALDAGRRAGEELVRRIGAEGVMVTPRLWPTPARAAENAARWTAFWADGRAERVRSLLAASGARYSFADDAFDPFLASLGPAAAGPLPPDAFLDRLRDRFVVHAGDRWQAVSLFPERAECRAAAREVAAADGDAFVVSRAELTEALSSSVADDMMRIAAVALVLVGVSVVVLVGSLRKAAVVLVPSVAGCVAAAATSVVRGVPLSVADLVAGIVVIGLNIDYGSFMAAAGGPEERSPAKGVTLCFSTTVAGTASLLFATHPALSTIGATLTAGVTTGYLVAVGCVPALRRLTQPPEEEART